MPSQIDAKARDWKLVPRHLQYSIKLWVDSGVKPGRFMEAVLKNDLKGAVQAGDPESTTGLVGIVNFLIWHCPAMCWGSPERVAEWPGRLQAMALVAEGAAAAGVEA